MLKTQMKNPFLLLAGMFFYLTLISSCSTMHTLNKLSKDDYTFVINDLDTFRFDKLFLDENLVQNISIDKKSKVVTIKTTGELEQILSIEDIEKKYSRDSIKVAFVIFQGNIFGTSVNNEKVYFQYSLVNKIERIKKDSLDGIGCRPPQGDIILIQ